MIDDGNVINLLQKKEEIGIRDCRHNSVIVDVKQEQDFRDDCGVALNPM